MNWIQWIKKGGLEGEKEHTHSCVGREMRVDLKGVGVRGEHQYTLYEILKN